MAISLDNFIKHKCLIYEECVNKLCFHNYCVNIEIFKTVVWMFCLIGLRWKDFTIFLGFCFLTDVIVNNLPNHFQWCGTEKNHKIILFWKKKWYYCPPLYNYCNLKLLKVSNFKFYLRLTVDNFIIPAIFWHTM